MDQEIVSLLKEIKFGIYVLIAGVAWVTTFSAFRFWQRIKPDYKEAIRQAFKIQAEEEFEKAKFHDLIKLCDEKLADFPNHSYALWYLGKAHYALQEYSLAKTTLEKLKATWPEWDESHVSPLLDAIAKIENVELQKK